MCSIIDLENLHIEKIKITRHIQIIHEGNFKVPLASAFIVVNSVAGVL